MAIPLLAPLAVGLWLFFQEGGVHDLETRLGPPMSVVVFAGQDGTIPLQQGQAARINAKTEQRSESIETPSQSLRRASILLHRAANTLESSEATAVQLIRQVIAILKHQVIPSLLDQHAVWVPIGSLSGLGGQGNDDEKAIPQMSN